MTVLVSQGESHSEHPPLPRRRRSGRGTSRPCRSPSQSLKPQLSSVNVRREDCAVCPAASAVGGRRPLQLLALALELDGRPGQETVLDAEDTGGCWDVLYETSESSTKTVPRNPRTGLDGWGRPDPREKRDVRDEN